MKVKANGYTFEFPEGTSEEQIGEALDEYFANEGNKLHDVDLDEGTEVESISNIQSDEGMNDAELDELMYEKRQEGSQEAPQETQTSFSDTMSDLNTKAREFFWGESKTIAEEEKDSGLVDVDDDIEDVMQNVKVTPLSKTQVALLRRQYPDYYADMTDEEVAQDASYQAQKGELVAVDDDDDEQVDITTPSSELGMSYGTIRNVEGSEKLSEAQSGMKQYLSEAFTEQAEKLIQDNSEAYKGMSVEDVAYDLSVNDRTADVVELATDLAITAAFPAAATKTLLRAAAAGASSASIARMAGNVTAGRDIMDGVKEAALVAGVAGGATVGAINKASNMSRSGSKALDTLSEAGTEAKRLAEAEIAEAGYVTRGTKNTEVVPGITVGDVLMFNDKAHTAQAIVNAGGDLSVKEISDQMKNLTVQKLVEKARPALNKLSDAAGTNKATEIVGDVLGLTNPSIRKARDKANTEVLKEVGESVELLERNLNESEMMAGMRKLSVDEKAHKIAQYVKPLRASAKALKDGDFEEAKRATDYLTSVIGKDKRSGLLDSDALNSAEALNRQLKAMRQYTEKFDSRSTQDELLRTYAIPVITYAAEAGVAGGVGSAIARAGVSKLSKDARKKGLDAVLDALEGKDVSKAWRNNIKDFFERNQAILDKSSKASRIASSKIANGDFSE